ncbi:hypothetical protein PoB_007453700 [Plakobranchus ocellatus]|uniref:Uncharacterized protein n=1 Tax=Plakobranchus ocellatus TaxID=259542 RepID=A0AAV4DUQ5_9GAST|nr:hypothetical protein PoB_007453700 [Plakobranchus ocellatus]
MRDTRQTVSHKVRDTRVGRCEMLDKLCRWRGCQESMSSLDQSAGGKLELGLEPRPKGFRRSQGLDSLAIVPRRPPVQMKQINKIKHKECSEATDKVIEQEKRYLTLNAPRALMAW